jgi:hypothetical protein
LRLGALAGNNLFLTNQSSGLFSRAMRGFKAADFFVIAPFHPVIINL